MKIAVFADLHLTDHPYSVKRIVLDWALNTAENLQVNCIIGIGDLTATGSRIQTDALLNRIAKCRIPFYSTPGNAELRSGENGFERLQILPENSSDFPFLLIDSSCGIPVNDDLQMIRSLPDHAGILLATHYPPEQWNAESFSVFEDAVKRGAVACSVSGHVHDDRPGCIRGLDPDKASGGPPMIAVFEQIPGGRWEKSVHVMPGVDPAEWNGKEVRSFLNVLGLCCLKEPLETLAFAAENKVPAIELRYGYPMDLTPELMTAIRHWRESGGWCLSVHLPEVYPDDPDSLNTFRDAVNFSLSANCDRVTVHVPRITAIEYPERKNDLVLLYLDLLAPLLEKKISVGIENLHTVKGKTADDQRNFGCNIAECKDFVNSLRDLSGCECIGFHLDIGHARNNVPFSATENVSDYYNAPGLPVNGFHFHQVDLLPDGTFQNHVPLLGWYEKLIVLSSFLILFRGGEIPVDVPVFLEISKPGGGIASYQKLRSFFPGFKCCFFS